MSKTIYPVNTRGFECNLILDIEVMYPVKLIVKGFDAEHINTTFFSRHLRSNDGGEFKGRRKVEFPMPLSPQKLLIHLFDQSTRKSDGIILHNIERGTLEKKLVAADDYMNAFNKFSKEIAMKAGYLRAGTDASPVYYESDDERFLFKYSQVIKDRKTGGVHPTPARIVRDTGNMELSQTHFVKLTVPSRVLVTGHEFQHHYKNTGDETAADIGALNQYLGAGFSKIEAVYTYTKVFPDTANNRARMEKILEFIDNF